MLLIAAGLIYALFQSLHKITHHGMQTKVPEVLGLNLPEAQKKLSGFKLQIDSIYQPYSNPLEIIYQEPKAGSIVKTGRTIFLTVNKTSPPTIAMPDLINMSFRNAVLTLQSYRLVMGDTIFKPDIAAGAVLDQVINGRSVPRGSMIPIGSRVDLIIGAGLADTTYNVPNMIGMSYGQAKILLEGLGVTTTIVWDGNITDSNTARIYKQFPESKSELEYPNTINPGDLIDLYIMQNPSPELLRLNQPGAIKFIDPNDSNARISFGPPTDFLPGEIDTNAPRPTTTTIAPPKPRIRKPKPQTDNNESDRPSSNDNDEIKVGTKMNTNDEPVNRRKDEQERVVPKAEDRRPEPSKPSTTSSSQKSSTQKPSSSKPTSPKPNESKKPKEQIKNNSATENEFN